MTSGEPMIYEQVDTLVSCYAPRSNTCLDAYTDRAKQEGSEIYKIGDAASPRTVEEAILEAARTAWGL